MDYNLNISNYKIISDEKCEKFFGTVGEENVKEMVEYLLGHLDKTEKIIFYTNSRWIEFTGLEWERLLETDES